MRALGVTDHRFLGGTGPLARLGHGAGRARIGRDARAAAPARLAARDALADQVDALTAVLEEVAPQVVVTYAADGGYGHPDHVRAHELTAAAVRRVPEVARLFATVIGRAAPRRRARRAVGRRRAAVPAARPRRAAGRPGRRRRRRARRLGAPPPGSPRWRAHATQVALWTDPGGRDGITAYAMSNGVAQPLLDVEEFVLLSGEPAPAGADDLFAGVAR